jgi:hypothetical protein
MGGEALMNGSPYREASPTPRSRSRREPLFEDASLLAALGVFWAVSLARVTGALARHEIFGGESTLALMVAIGVPLLLLRRRAQPPGRHEGSRPAP